MNARQFLTGSPKPPHIIVVEVHEPRPVQFDHAHRRGHKVVRALPIGESHFSRLLRDVVGEAEIDQHGLPMAVYQYVAGFDILMDQSVVVHHAHTQLQPVFDTGWYAGRPLQRVALLHKELNAIVVAHNVEGMVGRSRLHTHSQRSTQLRERILTDNFLHFKWRAANLPLHPVFRRFQDAGRCFEVEPLADVGAATEGLQLVHLHVLLCAETITAEH